MRVCTSLSLLSLSAELIIMERSMQKKPTDKSRIYDVTNAPRADHLHRPGKPAVSSPWRPAETDKQKADRTRMTVTGKPKPSPHKVGEA